MKEIYKYVYIKNYIIILIIIIMYNLYLLFAKNKSFTHEIFILFSFLHVHKQKQLKAGKEYCNKK
jgi:hypothetical protein